MPLTRRLAAILAADVVGYSHLMGIDEEGTHERFTAHRTELLAPKIEEHHGRVVKSTGDGLLAEFPSVVEAVLCAVEVQCGMTHRNLAVTEDARMCFRIGVNVGDVITEPEDIFGDGVNIAARLEGLAEPNGICISHIVYEQVRDKVPYAFEDIGRQSVKNISRPLHVFALSTDAIAALADSGGAAAYLAKPSSAPVARPHVGAPRLSIVVLPFVNLSDDREQQYLADAITDDLTTDLSRIPDMVVISRSTAFTYGGKPVDVLEIGRQLNVRYVVQGSIRRSGNRVRVNIQLTDAETNALVRAERFDHDTVDFLTLQDEVTRRIAVALDLELVQAAAARPTPHPDALDYILRARAALDNLTGMTGQSFAAGMSLVEKAYALDPNSPNTRSLLALVLCSQVLEQMSIAPVADLERADRLIAQVLAESPGDPVAHYAKGQALRARGRYDAAIPEYEAAIAYNRNWVTALASLGLCKFLTGSLDEAIPAQEEAIRLSPRDPRLPNWYWRIGMVHLLRSRTDEAVAWLERARSANPSLRGPHAWLASAYALQDRMEAARAELAETRRVSGDARYASIAAFRSSQPWAPQIQNLGETTFFAGLRLAGVPEE